MTAPEILDGQAETLPYQPEHKNSQARLPVSVPRIVWWVSALTLMEVLWECIHGMLVLSARQQVLQSEASTSRPRSIRKKNTEGTYLRTPKMAAFASRGHV